MSAFLFPFFFFGIGHKSKIKKTLELNLIIFITVHQMLSWQDQNGYCYDFISIQKQKRKKEIQTWLIVLDFSKDAGQHSTFS